MVYFLVYGWIQVQIFPSENNCDLQRYPTLYILIIDAKKNSRKQEVKKAVVAEEKTHVFLLPKALYLFCYNCFSIFYYNQYPTSCATCTTNLREFQKLQL